jgi:hypothetical protein
MLSTINGFDLLLIITIVVMGFKIYNLNRECESYVEQVLRLSWDLQAEIKDNIMWKAKYEYDSDLAEPAFEPASWELPPTAHNPMNEDINYCDCNQCIPF